MCVLPFLYPLPPPHLPLCPLGNSRLPDLTQTNLVNIYLFHADSRTQVLQIVNVTNPFGQAGQIAKQVDDLWFPDGGVDFNGSSISYPYYWVIIRSDKTLDGTEIPQATFTAVRKCCRYPSLLLANRLTLCRNDACRFCDIIHRLFIICRRIIGFCDVGLVVVGLSPGCFCLQLKERKWNPRELTSQFSVRLSPLGNCRHCCPRLFCYYGVGYSWVPPCAPCTAQ